MIKIKEAPQMKILHAGNSLKVLQVTAGEGMTMPEHFSTKEAVVIVQNGSATLKLKGQEHLLVKDQSFIIPEHVNHTLRIEENFQALVLMDKDSEIKFVGL